jgi:hypothetical protein
LVATCKAQSGLCPMDIQWVSSGPFLNASHRFVFAIRVKNTSGKDIRGYKVQPGFFDATEDLHASPFELGSHRPIKIGKIDGSDWPNPFFQAGGIGWVVVIKKVLFEDGSIWVGSEARPCYGEQWEDKKHPRLTKLPWELFTVKDVQ